MKIENGLRNFGNLENQKNRGFILGKGTRSSIMATVNIRLSTATG